jgi:hypothetical protein
MELLKRTVKLQNSQELVEFLAKSSSQGDFRQTMLSSLRNSLEFSGSFFQTATKKYSLIEFRGIGTDGMAGILIPIKILYQIS